MEIFFQKKNRKGVSVNLLTNRDICLFAKHVKLGVWNNPITKSIKFHVITDEELPNFVVTKTTAYFILSPVPNSKGLYHWTLIYCFRSHFDSYNIYFDPVNPGPLLTFT